MATNLLIGYPTVTFQVAGTSSHTLDYSNRYQSGPKSQITQLQSSTTGETTITWSASSTVEYFAIMKAIHLQKSGVEEIRFQRGVSNTNVYNNTTFQSTQLTGLRNEDFITTFSPVTDTQWRVVFDANSNSSTRPFSKIYFGSFFDFGCDPYSVRVIPIYNGDRNPYQVNKYEMRWRKITNTKRIEFENSIGRFAPDFNLVLHCSDSNRVLLSRDPLYVEIEPGSYDAKPYENNLNEISLIFREVY